MTHGMAWRPAGKDNDAPVLPVPPAAPAEAAAPAAAIEAAAAANALRGGVPTPNSPSFLNVFGREPGSLDSKRWVTSYRSSFSPKRH